MSSNSSSNGTDVKAAVESKPTVNGTAKTKPAAQTKKSAAAKSKPAAKSKAKKPAAKSGSRKVVNAKQKAALKYGKSTVESPVAVAWQTYDRVVSRKPNATRKECMAAAIAAGVNPATARTQYQIWLHAEAE